LGIEVQDTGRQPRRSAAQLARAVRDGRNIGAALRHLDSYGAEPEALALAEALARFLVARCESSHAGWRVLRQVVVDSNADAPWEKCARRAVPEVAADLLSLASETGSTRLVQAQHIAARRRAGQIADHLDHAALLAYLDLPDRQVSDERWRSAITDAVRARSREQVARAMDLALRD
jgi:hypothetical protein